MEPDFSRRLSPAVYRGDAFELAQNHLLGAYLCSEIDGELTAGMITELEVYIGSYDKATVWISPGKGGYPFVARPRIGIDYAEEYKDKPWRFYIKDNRFVSKK